jgi:hypothetical protein
LRGLEAGTTPATRHPAARTAGREVALVVVLNGERAHSGRLTAGRTPFEAIIGAGQDAAATTKTCRTTPEAVQPGRYLAVGASSSPDAWSLPARAVSRRAAS